MTTIPMPSSRDKDANTAAPTNNSHDQILVALDSISVKLIRSEADREMIRRELELTKNAGTRLEQTLDTARKNEEETKQRLDNALRDLDLSKARQERLDEKLREATAQMATLSRRLEAEEKRRTRLYRRMERLEAVAKTAQESLQAKAMVLLTDRTLAIESGRPMVDLDNAAQPKSVLAADVPLPSPLQSLPPLPEGQGDVPPAARAGIKMHWIVILVAAVLLGVLGWKVSQFFELPAAQESAQESVQEKTYEQKTEQPQSQPVQATIGQPTVTADVPAALRELSADPKLPEAFKPLEQKALSEHDGPSLHDLAALYVAGKNGVPTDYARARALFVLSAKSGVSNAAYNLGVIAHQGLGQPKNEPLAQAWYMTAAVKNHAEALYNLGIARIEGGQTAYNPQLAAWYFAQAALGGVAEAAYNLGLIFDNGLLGETRPDLAAMWYRLGAERGHAESKTQLDKIAGQKGVDASALGLTKEGKTLMQLVLELPQNDPAARAEQQDEMLAELPDMDRLLMEREQVETAEVETLLQTRGLYKGPVDGAANAALRAAIKTYQKQQALKVDGLPAEALLTYMLSEQIDALSAK